MQSFADQRKSFSENKKALSPTFKPETNIPANILNVKSVRSTIENSPTDNSQYANLKLIVDVENEDGTVATKEWNISSDALAETLEDKGVDVGSSFTVLKSGEGFKTKYAITNVKNKDNTANASATPAQPTAPSSTPTSPVTAGAKPE